MMVLVSGFKVFYPLGFNFVKGVEKNSHDIF